MSLPCHFLYGNVDLNRLLANSPIRPFPILWLFDLHCPHRTAILVRAVRPRQSGRCRQFRVGRRSTRSPLRHRPSRRERARQTATHIALGIALAGRSNLTGLVTVVRRKANKIGGVRPFPLQLEVNLFFPKGRILAVEVADLGAADAERPLNGEMSQLETLPSSSIRPKTVGSTSPDGARPAPLSFITALSPRIFKVAPSSRASRWPRCGKLSPSADQWSRAMPARLSETLTPLRPARPAALSKYSCSVASSRPRARLPVRKADACKRCGRLSGIAREASGLRGFERPFRRAWSQPQPIEAGP
ncbi:hypothetical protein AB7M35_000939 [Amorphus suaedae]